MSFITPKFPYRLMLVVLLAFWLASTGGPSALAHEPLWGETPIVFSSGLLHPEIKVKFMDAGDASDGGERSRMFEQEYMVQYAPSTRLNLRLEVPLRRNLRQELVGGQVRSTLINGLGDIVLSGKSRVGIKQEEGLSIQQTVVYGVKLPTGQSHHLDPDGDRASPHDQTGSGKPGIVLGYAIDRETIKDTIWANVEYRRDLGKGFRMGDMMEFNLAYGRWLRIANEADDLGFNLAAGIYGELHRNDFMGGGVRAANKHTLVGLHITPIITKGRNQFRVGALVPIYRRGPEDHVRFPIELRAAVETFF